MLSQQGVYRLTDDNGRHGMVVVTLLSRSIDGSRCFKASLSARRSDPLQDGLSCVMDVDIETHKGSLIYLGFALSPYAFTRSNVTGCDR